MFGLCCSRILSTFDTMNGEAFVVTLDFQSRFQDVRTPNFRWFQSSLERFSPQTDNEEWFYRSESKDFHDSIFLSDQFHPDFWRIFSPQSSFPRIRVVGG